MAAFSDWSEQNILDHMLNDAALAANIAPTITYIALFTADPTDVTATAYTVEVFKQSTPSASSYARDAITAGWTIGSSGTITATSPLITFPAETGANYTVTHWGIFDAAAEDAGNLMFHGVLDASRPVTNAGDIVSFAAGALVIELQ